MNDHPLDPLLDPTPRDTPRPASGRGARRPSGSRRSGDRGQQRTGAPRAGGGRPPQRRGGASIAQWLPAVAAIGLLGTVVLAGVALGGGDDGSGQIGQGEPASVAPVPTNAPLTVPESVPDVTTPLADAPEADKVPLERTLSKGLAGDDVSRVQERLTELGFVPGPADGIYGDQTIKAVWAYEKLVMGVASNEPTGKVTPEMWDRMQDNFRINPRRPNAPSANHTEVYLPEQVLAVFHDDTPVMITHMSSGTGEEWCEEVTISPGEYGNRDGEEPLVRGECGISNTPGGVFQFYRQVEGIRDSALGSMWNPMYFNYGIAIHGALNVPLQPASHGCIRIPLNISEGLQDIVAMNDMIYVWDGEKEPEENGSPPRCGTGCRTTSGSTPVGPTPRARIT
ncbi:MAG: L,D-transpeptidase family protein, partial [Actinomycetota bacterium]